MKIGMVALKKQIVSILTIGFLSVSILVFASTLCRVVAFEKSEQKGASIDIAIFSDYLPTNSKLNQIENTPLQEIKKHFSNPGVDYSSGPLWVWNDLLTEGQIRSTLADLNSQNINQAFVHPRPGLATPYLSDEWFKLWDVALDEAQKRGMKIWIYDENSYPSGFAGGFVPESMPESRGAGLDVLLYDELIDEQGKWSAGESVLYVLELLPDNKTTIDRTTEALKAKETGSLIPVKTHPSSRWIVGRKQLASLSQWFGGKSYVNLLTPGVLKLFLGITHEAYRNCYGDKFGNLIPGTFTDEPNISPAGMFSWCDDFSEEFKKRCGYDLVPNIGSLVAPIGDWKKVRYDYYKVTLDLFNERWHRPFGGYCESIGLEYTGHDWEHEWPNAHAVPDNMATAFWRQRPAIDLLMNQFSREMHSQFGNVRSVRELNSVAHQSGRRRTLSENYGAGGYDICFADLKRLGDWAYALGVNTTNEHLSYISIRGARKHDHPQTFSYHSSWFEQYSKLEDYWTRLSYILSRGKLTSERFLLIEPTSTIWLYQNACNGEEKKKDQIGIEFTALLNKLEEEQIDYDLGCEDIFRYVGSVDQNELIVGKARYKKVVLPPNLENLDEKTVRLLASFVQNGGEIVSLGSNFSLVSGQAINDLDLTQNPLKKECDAILKAQKEVTFDELVHASRQSQPVTLIPSSNATNLFHQSRETNDAIIFFVCNISLEKEATGHIVLNEPWKDSTIEFFDSLTGTISPYNAKILRLNPCESMTLVISPRKTIDPTSTNLQHPYVLTTNDLINSKRLKTIKAVDDNVLVLDYVTLKTTEKTIFNDYFYRVNNQFWQMKGFSQSPWDNGVQFNDELITKTFDDESGFELIYQFNKSSDNIDDLRFVVENPKMYEVYCNGQKIEQIPNKWKFDRSFGVYHVANAVQTGLNEIRLIATKSTIFTEIMPTWLIGSFTLKPDSRGFTIVGNQELSLVKPIDNESLLPKASGEQELVNWLSSGIGFSQQNDVAPFIAFRFNNATKIDAFRIWNYSESNHTYRGIKDFELSVLDEKGKTILNIGSLPSIYHLERGNGSSQTIVLPQTIELQANWQILFTIKSNWNGIEYPLSNSLISATQNVPNDNAFVGVSEIQFLQKNVNEQLIRVKETPQASASSELVFRTHDRRAQYAVNGSGLSEQDFGWAAQGLPFYAGRVNYVFSIPLDSLPQRIPIQLELSNWRGAVAAVSVDSKQIGAIGWKNETVDLTTAISTAKQLNKEIIELTIGIYGTPKNLFGPHHAGQLRGSAWPSSFHSAPSSQPAGTEYDVIEYGLFFE